MATIVSLSTIIGDEPHGIIWGHQSRIRRGEF
jgi:hypothetical protein